jgi:hypothetical protein
MLCFVVRLEKHAGTREVLRISKQINIVGLCGRLGDCPAIEW